ncbi:ATP-binding protein [Amycolatopsis sp. NPDC051373]|uniref:ATP-binding protein n=1 Tax=Amycolatopsis sp. NPDC051373 TaxID=3155801 RepID=UPI00344CA912
MQPEGMDLMSDPTIMTITAGEHPHIDEYWIRENHERNQKSAQRVPRRYQDAVATVPELRAWATILISRAGVTSTGVIPDGPSVLMLGRTGTGKTYQAYGAIRALLASGAGFSWELVTAPDLYARMRPRHGIDSESGFVSYARSKVLVVDDLGAAKNSEWIEEVNYRLINYRYDHELPTLFTSNVPPKDLTVALGDRVASRLIEMCERVSLKGDDRRRTQGDQ